MGVGYYSSVILLFFYILGLTNLNKADHTAFCTIDVHVPCLSVLLTNLLQLNTYIYLDLSGFSVIAKVSMSANSVVESQPRFEPGFLTSLSGVSI